MTDSESKRTEYLRSQMSVMERVEWLEQRSASHDGTIVDHDIRIGDLARRVAELEKGRKGDPRFPAGAPTADVHIPTECYERTFERVFIDASDLARLRRIEEAARDLLKKMSPYEWYSEVTQSAKSLCAALDSEPKR